MRMKSVFFSGLLCFVMLFSCGASAVTSSSSIWNVGTNDTVTISREEYERLLKYDKLDMISQIVDMYYYDEVDHDKMMDGACSGLLEGVGDYYTFYYTKEEMDEFDEKTDGEYAGIGCQLLADPESELITVTRVFKNSPAEKAGIRSGDKIVYVNDTYYTAHEMNEAVSVMRGTPGENVKVTVLRGEETQDFDILREKVEINYVEYQILEGNIGYIMVYDFLGDALEQFTEAINVFRENKISGMIIDLRDNGGGLVDDAVGMADLILPEGTVVSMKDKYGNETKRTIDADYYQVPMCVLVNGYSASASEILSGAIRDYKAGTLIGTKTFGKGIVQGVIPFADGSGMQVTTDRYYTPAGECIHGVGITPDIEVELDEDAVTLYGLNNLPHDQDAQLQKAIEVLTSGNAAEEQK